MEEIGAVSQFGLTTGRRTLLASAAGLVPALAAAQVVGPEKFGRAALDRLEALVKMRGSTDGRIGFSWISGTRYARVGSELIPMCGLLNCTFSRYRRLSADSFDLRLYEISFYTDPATGVYAPRLRMPFTETLVEVPLYRTGPGHHVVKVANTEQMSWSSANTTGERAASQLAPDGAIDYSVTLSEPTIVGDHLWLTTEATTQLRPTDPSKKPWYYKELITNRGSLLELSDPRNSHVDATASYTLVMDWRPWMELDDLAGQTVDHAIGGRVWRLEDLPAEILWHIRKHHPDVAENPWKWIPE